jgi:hypothetical protein
MENIEIEVLSCEEFYTTLKITIAERIAELRNDIRLYENIERDRGLFGYEKARIIMAGKALTTNESFAMHFDKNFLNMH